MTVVPFQDALTADVRPALLVLLAAVGLLFATAIASVVVLQSARAVKRRREMAVRAAIGAGSGRLTMLWLLESLVLGAVGGSRRTPARGGLPSAAPGGAARDFPRMDDVALDLRVGFFAIALALGAAVVCGLVPALQSRIRALTASFASDGFAWRTGATRARGVRLRAVMMAAQVAVACLLLVGRGCSPAALPRSWPRTAASTRTTCSRLHATIRDAARLPLRRPRSNGRRTGSRALPGVTHAAVGNALPFVTLGGMSGIDAAVAERSGHDHSRADADARRQPRVFRGDGTAPRGRADAGANGHLTSRPVVVVNRTFAAQYLGLDARGHGPAAAVRAAQGLGGGRRRGRPCGKAACAVAPPPLGGLTDPPQPELFFTYRQWDVNVSEVIYVVRSAMDPAALAPAVRTILGEEMPAAAVESIMTMEDRLMESLARPRTYAMLVAGFAIFAAAVALVGLFGVLSHMAAQRTREIGMRSALGARPRDILGLVTREAAGITHRRAHRWAGSAFVLSRGLATLLYGVSTHDAATFVAVPAGLLVAAALACAFPAARAARVSPLVALRSE